MLPPGSIGARVIGQLHYVVEIALLIVAPNLQHIHQAFVRAGDRLELLHAAKFPFIRTIVLKGLSINHLDRAISAHCAPRQPHLAVAARTNAPDQFVFGHSRDKLRQRYFLPACWTRVQRRPPFSQVFRQLLGKAA